MYLDVFAAAHGCRDDAYVARGRCTVLRRIQLYSSNTRVFLTRSIKICLFFFIARPRSHKHKRVRVRVRVKFLWFYLIATENRKRNMTKGCRSLVSLTTLSPRYGAGGKGGPYRFRVRVVFLKFITGDPQRNYIYVCVHKYIYIHTHICRVYGYGRNTIRQRDAARCTGRNMTCFHIARATRCTPSLPRMRVYGHYFWFHF